MVTCSGASYIFRYNHLVTDSASNIYVMGDMNITGGGVVDFGNGITITDSAENDNVFVKYSSSGTPLWAKNIQSASSFTIEDIDISSVGNVAVVMNTNGTGQVVNFSNGVQVAPPSGQASIIAAYSTSGTTLWAYDFEISPADHYSYGVAIDPQGYVYLAGYVDSSGEYALSPTVSHTFPAAGGIYWARYSPSGVAEILDGPSVAPDWSMIDTVNLDSNANAYLFGEIDSTSEYDFGNGVTITSPASWSTFTLKLEGIPVPPNPTTTPAPTAVVRGTTSTIAPTVTPTPIEEDLLLEDIELDKNEDFVVGNEVNISLRKSQRVSFSVNDQKYYIVIEDLGGGSIQYSGSFFEGIRLSSIDEKVKLDVDE